MRTFLAIAATLAATAVARCPNLCSGHGECGVDDICTCFTGFRGADCSERACPEAESWAIDMADPHTHSECANRGSCDRATGSCECFPGFEGEACQRSSCQNGCSGHGRCVMLQDLPFYNPGASLTWDESAMMGCVCDGGYFGPDCSLRNCPYGDDPATVCDQTNNLEQVQELRFYYPLNFDGSSTDTIRGSVGLIGNEFSLRFETPQGQNYSTKATIGAWGDGAVTQTAPLDTAGASVAAANPLTSNQDTHAQARIELALEALPNYAVRDVSVTHYSRTISGTLYQNAYRITFHHLAEGQNSYGAQKLLTCDLPEVCASSGCQPRVRQPYAAAIFEGADGSTAAMVQVAIASLETLQNDVTSSAGTWVKFHQDSVLSCPTTASSCVTGQHSKLYAGINIYYDNTNDEVWVRAFGNGDSEAPILHSNTGTGGQLATITGGTWAYRPSKARKAVASNNYRYVGTLTDANEGKFDITDIIPNTYLQFETTVNAGAADRTASIFFQPAYCAVADVTQSGSPLANPDIENIECSGRGECDRASGQCECFEGYTGSNCGKVSTIL